MSDSAPGSLSSSGKNFASRNLTFSNFHDTKSVSFPEEWQELMRSRTAENKTEVFFETWRRLIFYMFFFSFLVYINKFPTNLTSIYSWIWVANTLYFELSLCKQNKNNFFVIVLHPIAFSSTFAGAVFEIITIIIQPKSVLNRVDTKHFTSPVLAWLLVIWINFLPIAWNCIDLFVHRELLKKKHALRFPTDTKLTLFKQILKIIWFLIGTPILFATWIGLGFYPIDTSYVRPNDYIMIIAILSIVHVGSSLVLFGVMFEKIGDRAYPWLSSFKKTFSSQSTDRDEDGITTLLDSDAAEAHRNLLLADDNEESSN